LKAIGEIMSDKKSMQEKIEELYEFLQGKVPPRLSMKHPPRLSQQKAFRVIYFLQEVTGILPDNFERCRGCGCIIDTYFEGVFFNSNPDDKETLDGKPIPKSWEGDWCDDCAPQDWRWL